VIIPAFNEEKRLTQTLAKTVDYLNKQNYTWEILVISDGSTDQTVKAVSEPSLNGVKVIDNKVNHGKGYVVRQAMLAASGEYRLFMDADNSTKIQEIEKFWPKTKEGFEVIIGSRHTTGSNIRVEQLWYRQILGRLGNWLTQILLLWGIEDTQCGFKLFSRKATETVFKYQTISGWGFDMEILLIAKLHKFKIIDAPVNWYNEGESKFRSLSGYFSTLIELFKIRINAWQGKYK